ncbi:hypothetical protein QQ045_032441 [Rhodiola kirilowii]
MEIKTENFHKRIRLERKSTYKEKSVQKINTKTTTKQNTQKNHRQPNSSTSTLTVTLDLTPPIGPKRPTALKSECRPSTPHDWFIKQGGSEARSTVGITKTELDEPEHQGGEGDGTG